MYTYDILCSKHMFTKFQQPKMTAVFELSFIFQ